jgi:NCS1 family nucleobase:cation symporter-1
VNIRNPSPNLYNEDLAPAKERHWGAFSIFNVWTSDVHSLWGYYLAASLFLLCGSFLSTSRRSTTRTVSIATRVAGTRTR